MNPYQVHANSMAALMTEQGADCPVITWNNQQYRALPGSAINRKDLGIGGFQANSNLTFTILASEFAASFANVSDLKNVLLQDRLDYLGDTYKVESVSILPGGLQLHIEANSLNQRA